MDQSAIQENRFAVFKFRVTVRAHMNIYMTISDIYIYLSNCWPFLHPNLVGWHVILSWRGVICCCCVCLKNRLLFSRSRSQGRSKTLLNLYYFISSVPLISWEPNLLSWLTIVNNQIKYKKWAYTEKRTLTYSIIRYTMRGYFAAQGDKPCWSCVWWFYCCFGVRMRPCRFFHR